jgi:nucleoside-diphosphate-sugar epimerase
MPTKTQRTVLVTGAAGFLGSHVTRALLRRGHRVVACDLAAQPEGRYGLYDPALLRYFKSDFTDRAALAQLLAAAPVTDAIHIAGILPGNNPDAFTPETYLRVNVQASWQLAETLRALPGFRRMVAVTSSAVYGIYPPEAGPIAETAAPRPTGFYGASKASMDLALAQYRAKGLDVAAGRLPGLYGPWGRYPGPLFKMVEAAAAGTPYRLPQGGDARFEQICIKDVARGLLALMDAPRLSHYVYNLGINHDFPVSQIARDVKKAVPSADIEVGPGEIPGRTPQAPMSSQRIAEDIGFKPKFSLETGLAEYIRWTKTGDYGTELDAE